MGKRKPLGTRSSLFLSFPKAREDLDRFPKKRLEAARLTFISGRLRGDVRPNSIYRALASTTRRSPGPGRCFCFHSPLGEFFKLPGKTFGLGGEVFLVSEIPITTAAAGDVPNLRASGMIVDTRPRDNGASSGPAPSGSYEGENSKESPPAWLINQKSGADRPGRRGFPTWQTPLGSMPWLGV